MVQLSISVPKKKVGNSENRTQRKRLLKLKRIWNPSKNVPNFLRQKLKKKWIKTQKSSSQSASSKSQEPQKTKLPGWNPPHQTCWDPNAKHHHERLQSHHGSSIVTMGRMWNVSPPECRPPYLTDSVTGHRSQTRWFKRQSISICVNVHLCFINLFKTLQYNRNSKDSLLIKMLYIPQNANLYIPQTLPQGSTSPVLSKSLRQRIHRCRPVRPSRPTTSNGGGMKRRSMMAFPDVRKARRRHGQGVVGRSVFSSGRVGESNQWIHQAKTHGAATKSALKKNVFITVYRYIVIPETLGRSQNQQVCIILAAVFRHGLVVKPHLIYLGLCLP